MDDLQPVPATSLYFRDNFFSAGTTEILNEYNEQVGFLDLKSMWGRSIDLYGYDQQLLYQGRFPFLSNKWHVSNSQGELLGILRRRLTWVNKKFTYDTFNHGIYEILSPAFSREYNIIDENGEQIAYFKKINRWSSSAFVLENYSDRLDSYELAIVVMGMHAIQKQSQSAAHNSAHT